VRLVAGWYATAMDADSSSRPVRTGRLVRAVLLIAGSLCLALGLVGVVVPVLPTTPLLIVAAYCYARSSRRCYQWLTTNRVFGRYLDDYLHGRGVPWQVKASALVFLWTVITLSAVLFVNALWLRVLLFVIALAVSVHVVALKGRVGAGQSRRS
jgi:uncharacterized membrane protein YbaN (DUF454 family)